MLRPTVTRPVCLGVRPLWCPISQFCYCQTVGRLLTRGRVCSLQLLLAIASAVILGSESRGPHDHVLFLQIRDFSNPEGQVPVFTSPRNLVTQLYPQALGSLYVTSYDLQVCAGCIRTASTLASRFSQSQILLYDWRFTANHFILATSPLRITIRFGGRGATEPFQS
jgi:hypothetical protein